MLLLNAGRVVSREQLIDGLWEAEPPPRAGRSLETKVSRLRAALGDSANVVARSGGYVFQASAEDVDVYRFEQALDEGRSLLAEHPAAARARLEGALALWRGRPLSGLPDGVLAVERARLEAERLQALEARIDADLALGEGTSLVGELQELRSEYPARERFAEQLMLALYRSGRQTDALEVYRETYRRLRDELGLDPNPRLRELERAILRQDESLGPLPLRARARLAGDSWRPRLTGVIAVGCVLALAVIFVASSGGSHQRPLSHGPGLILVDAATGAVRADVSVGDSTGGTRFGYGHLWTLGENGVMAEIDPVNGALVRFVPVGVVWGGMAVGAGGIWVSDRYGLRVLRIDPGTGQINLRRRLSSLGLSDPQPNSGIAVRHGALVITTRRPVRDLPARLALPYFCVLPAGTPTALGGYEDPLPTAGPYYLAEHEGGVLAVVRPNPNYSGTRPGRLDGIVFQIDIGERAAITRVRHGQLDYFTGRSTAVSGRVGCRTKLPGIPGLDLAAICIRSTAG